MTHSCAVIAIQAPTVVLHKRDLRETGAKQARRRECRIMRLPCQLQDVMRRQHGLLPRPQILEADVPSATLDAWVARAHLEVVETGVYRLPGSAIPDAQRLLAAVLRAGAGACLAGWSACALYGFEGFDLRQRAWVAIPARRRVRGVDFIVERTDLARGQVAVVDGIRATIPHRALLDAAGRVTPKAARVGIDDGRRKGMVTLERLLQTAVELGNHPGAVAVRRLFGSGALDQDGELERQLALALHAVGLQPVWGMEVLPRIVVDACFRDASYILEGDGGYWHTIETDLAADVSREGALLADGWLVRRIRSDELRDQRDELLAEIKATTIARRDAGLGRRPDWRPVRPGRRIRPPRAR